MKINLTQSQKKYIKNTSWLFLTQGLRLVAGFFIGLWLARYLGPSDYGIFNYVTSIGLIWGIFSVWGTTEIILKRIIDSKTETEENEILSNAFFARLIIGFIFSILFIVYTYLFHFDSKILFLLVAPTLLFQSFEVIDLFYRAKVRVKSTSINKILILIISSALKIYFIFKGMSLGYFLFLFSFDSIVYGIFIYLFFSKTENINLLSIMPKKNICLNILKESTPLMFVSLFSLSIRRIDQIMINNILGSEALGIYASAFRILEICNLIPLLLLSSLFTAVLNAKKTDEYEYLARLRKFARFQLTICISLTLLISFFSHEIVSTLFGERFNKGGDLLKFLIFSLIPMSFSQVGLMWHISEGLTKLLVIKLLIALVVSGIFNFIFLTKWGLMGSPFPLLISTFITYYVIDYFHPATRKLLKLNLGI